MNYTSKNIDIETMYNKYMRGQISLDAEFQRGEVWNLVRKKKLVDTILRQWPIPPVQFLPQSDGTFEVLDGLQRISTIISFLKGNIYVDASIRPYNEDLSKLNGMSFKDIERNSKDKGSSIKDLCLHYYNRILNTSISIYEIHEASPEEIAELFDRFNSPMLLNTVEKRNAFFGKTRNQINSLTVEFEKMGANKQVLGFSNNRGSYEDIIAKVCYSIGYSTANRKITSDDLVNLYRNNEEFSDVIVNAVKVGMERLLESISDKFEQNMLKLPRAAVFSLLLFCAVNQNVSQTRIAEIVNFLYLDDTCVLSPLRRLFEENTSFASTDVRSIKTRQYILMILSNELFSIADIDYENRYIEQISKTAEGFDYINNEFER